MSDFSVHRIIGRGGFGEVFGCRKVDTGKMYAMKCLGMIHIYDSVHLFFFTESVRQAFLNHSKRYKAYKVKTR